MGPIRPMASILFRDRAIDEAAPTRAGSAQEDWAIANSIRALGFNLPLLIGKDNAVVDGGSIEARSRQIAWSSSVPCIRVDHLDETEQRLLRLAVNRLGEKGFWDDPTPAIIITSERIDRWTKLPRPLARFNGPGASNRSRGFR